MKFGAVGPAHPTAVRPAPRRLHAHARCIDQPRCTGLLTLRCAIVGRIRDVRLHIALIVLAGVLVYGNGLSGPLLFDDETSILSNTLHPPADPAVGAADARRATPRWPAGRWSNLTFALNYAIGGLDVTGYHVVNLVVHLLAALTLYGIVRRTLRLQARCPRALGHDADLVALAAAMLWVVHPLNSESVSYLTERTESLMGLFYLRRFTRRFAPPRSATSRPLDRAGGRGVGAGHGVERVHGHGAGDGAALRSRVPVQVVARGLGRATLPLCRPGRVVGGAGADPVVRRRGPCRVRHRHDALELFPQPGCS